MINNSFLRNLSSVNAENVEHFKSIVADAKTISVIPHVNPDGDAMGSGLALVNVLLAMGKTAKFVSPSKTAPYLSWMNTTDDVIDFSAATEEATAFLKQSDVIVCVDFNTLHRAEGMADIILESKAKKVMIDHHPFPENGFDLVFSETIVSSTCELMLNVLLAANYDEYVNKHISELLYAGIITDTGSLSHNSSSFEIYLAIAELLRHGADKQYVHDRLFFTNSESRLRFLGHCLNDKMVILPEYKTAYITVSLADQSRFNFKQGDSEGFVNYPLTIEGICFSVLITETTDKVKMSFRSKGDFAANAFSEKHFNGGGHKNAAGGRSFKSLGEAVQDFIAALPEFKDELHNA